MATPRTDRQESRELGFLEGLALRLLCLAAPELPAASHAGPRLLRQPRALRSPCSIPRIVPPTGHPPGDASITEARSVVLVEHDVDNRESIELLRKPFALDRLLDAVRRYA